MINKIIKIIVKWWMKNNWGERCLDFDQYCCVCKAWKYYDYLFEDEDDWSEST